MKKNKKPSKLLNHILKYGDRLMQDWFLNGVLVTERVVYLEGDYEIGDPSEVTSNMVSKFIKAMTILECLDEDEPIIVIINTCGGSVFDGFAIYDRMRESPCPIIGFGYGSIMSMGALIMQAADKRIVAPNSTIMIHDGTTSSGDVHPSAMKAWAEYDTKITYNIHKIYYERMLQANKKLTFKEVETMCMIDKIFFPEDAVKIGLVDKIGGKPKRMYE